ncbi:MAG: rhodanese-like domain-containing protein [Chloroflexales bacterium]|nr:rhodanese-like domain-containing protein [Chloroflexales bacterium]
MTISPQSPRKETGARQWTLILAVLTFLAGAGLLGIIVLVSRPPQPAPAPLAATDEPAVTLESAHGDQVGAGPAIERIALEAAKTHYDDQTAIFVDVRSGQEFEELHIAGAASITSEDLETRLRRLPPGAIIITYAGRANEETSVRGAQIFMEFGYSDVRALAGGLESWHEQGYPTASGR